METLEIPRDRSGFAREMGTFDVFVFNVLGYSMGVALATNAPFIGAFAPQAGMAAVLTFGLIVALLNGLTYGCFSACLPHNGGDYVFVEATFGRGWGFVANFGFTVSQMYGLALVAGWTFSAALVPALATFGAVAGEPGVSALADRLANPLVYFGGGTALLLLILFVTSLGPRPVKLFLNVIFFLAMSSTVVLAFVMLRADHAEFVSRFNSFMQEHGRGPNAYASILNSWEAQGGVRGAPTSLWDSLRAVPLGFLLFLGFTYSVYVGSEVRRPAKSQSRGILLALVVGYITFVIVMSRYIVVVGRDFNAAIGNADVLTANPLPAGTSMVFFAGLLTDSTAVNVLLNVGSFLWFAILPFVIVQVCVRNVHAWSLDRIFPESLSRLTLRRQAPVAAALLVLTVAWGLLALTIFAGIALVGAVALSAVCFLITGIAAAVYPARRRDDFKLAPRLARQEVAGIPLMAIVGALSAISFAFILYSSIKFPQVSMGEDRTALLMVVGVYGFGTAWYLIRMNLLGVMRRRALSDAPHARLEWTAQPINEGGTGTPSLETAATGVAQRSIRADVSDPQ